MTGRYFYDGLYYAAAGYGSLALMSEGLQSEFNKMIESVKTYHGFYVGRYELGIDINNASIPTSKAEGDGVIVANSGYSETYMWYGLYTKCKEYAPESENEAVVSAMMWGSQYDAIMNWLIKNGINVTTTLGGNQSDVLNNIYDIYKSHLEWTMEANIMGSYYSRISRGGNASVFYYPSYRDAYNVPTSISEAQSTRITLYINN